LRLTHTKIYFLTTTKKDIIVGYVKRIPPEHINRITAPSFGAVFICERNPCVKENISIDFLKPNPKLKVYRIRYEWAYWEAARL
jgi:hypothetical protein